MQMVIILAPLSNKKMNFYTCPRLTFLKQNATENAYKSTCESQDFKIFWPSALETYLVLFWSLATFLSMRIILSECLIYLKMTLTEPEAPCKLTVLSHTHYLEIKAVNHSHETEITVREFPYKIRAGQWKRTENVLVTKSTTTSSLILSLLSSSTTQQRRRAVRDDFTKHREDHRKAKGAKNVNDAGQEYRPVPGSFSVAVSNSKAYVKDNLVNFKEK